MQSNNEITRLRNFNPSPSERLFAIKPIKNCLVYRSAATAFDVLTIDSVEVLLFDFEKKVSPNKFDLKWVFD
jgi:hypothetical protein